MTTLVIDTPEAMEALGGRLARQLGAGDLVLLNGDLGAGKTTLARGLGAELGVRGTVTSPTFVLARTHPRADGVPLVHVDAYRLHSALELDDLDIDYDRSIVVVEWGAGLLDGITENWLEVDIVRPTGGPAAMPETVTASITVTTPVTVTASIGEPLDGPEPRLVAFTGHGDRWHDLGWVGVALD